MCKKIKPVFIHSGDGGGELYLYPEWIIKNVRALSKVFHCLVRWAQWGFFFPPYNVFWYKLLYQSL